jgi:large-conductance mechanosensitive channel
MDNLSHFTNPSKFKEQLKRFILDNGVIGTAAGVSIALVTKDIIQSFVGDIIIPSFIFVLSSLQIKGLTEMLPGKKMLDLTNFFKQLISWVLVIVITYLFITFTFQVLLGIQITKEDSAAIKKKEGFLGGMIMTGGMVLA